MKKGMLVVVIGVFALMAVPWLLYFVVRVATTSCSIDWVDLDKVDSVASANSWWPRGWEDCRHFVQLKDGRRLAVVFERWGCHKPRSDCYMLEIRSDAGIALHDETVQVSIPGREGCNMRIELHRDADMSLAEGRFLFHLPIELSPKKGGEELEIRFRVLGAGNSSEMDEVKLKFRALSVCHYLNIFTDIT